MASALICWGDDSGINFGVGEDDLEDRDDLNEVNTYEGLQEWLDEQYGNDNPMDSVNRTLTGFAGDPFYILYIHADKYAFMDTLPSKGGHGALVITKQAYLDYIDKDFNGTVDELVAKMKEVAMEEFKMLQAWYGQSVFGFIHEQDIPTVNRKPFENPVKVVDSVWGFYLLDTDYQTMLQAMCEHFDPNNEALKEIKERMLADQS